MPLRAELNRTKEQCNKERTGRVAAQQQIAQLKDQVAMLENANENLDREVKTIPALAESNEILKNDLAQLRRRYKDEKAAMTKHIKTLEGQSRDVETIKGCVRELSMKLLDLANTGNVPGSMVSSSLSSGLNLAGMQKQLLICMVFFLTFGTVGHSSAAFLNAVFLRCFCSLSFLILTITSGASSYMAQQQQQMRYPLPQQQQQQSMQARYGVGGMPQQQHQQMMMQGQQQQQYPHQQGPSAGSNVYYQHGFNGAGVSFCIFYVFVPNNVFITHFHRLTNVAISNFKYLFFFSKYFMSILFFSPFLW